MRVDSSIILSWNPSTNVPAHSGRAQVNVAAGGVEAISLEASEAARPLDFTRMTRQELADWTNEQIRSGRMSLHESTPFVGMTVRFSAATGGPVDMATDTTRYDFMARAQGGIEFALSRGDQAGAERLQAALDIMRNYQGQSSGLDLVA